MERERENVRERTLSVVVGSAKNWLYNQFMFVAVITFPFIKKQALLANHHKVGLHLGTTLPTIIYKFHKGRIYIRCLM